jgi:hypothetical protein
VPAYIWGFGHSTYPNQPFFIRGLEVGTAGVLIGFLMLRFGVVPLLVWHFTVDAIYTALLLLRSGNAYYVISGAIAAGILLLPLGVSLVLYARRGGFLAAAGPVERRRRRRRGAGLGPWCARRRRVRRSSAAARGARDHGRDRARALRVALPAVEGGRLLAEDAVGARGPSRWRRRFLRVNGVDPARGAPSRTRGPGSPTTRRSARRSRRTTAASPASRTRRPAT